VSGAGVCAACRHSKVRCVRGGSSVGSGSPSRPKKKIRVVAPQSPERTSDGEEDELVDAVREVGGALERCGELVHAGLLEVAKSVGAQQQLLCGLLAEMIGRNELTRRAEEAERAEATPQRRVVRGRAEEARVASEEEDGAGGTAEEVGTEDSGRTDENERSSGGIDEEAAGSGSDTPGAADFSFSM
jgi:hypothetical protein